MSAKVMVFNEAALFIEFLFDGSMMFIETKMFIKIVFAEFIMFIEFNLYQANDV